MVVRIDIIGALVRGECQSEGGETQIVTPSRRVVRIANGWDGLGECAVRSSRIGRVV